MAREPFNRIWTETPTVDDFDEPTEAMWDEGWRGGADQDPPEAFAQNWWQNRADFALQQIERNGAMGWLGEVPYGKNAEALGADGESYIAVQANQDIDPTTDDGSNWAIKKVGYSLAKDGYYHLAAGFTIQWCSRVVNVGGDVGDFVEVTIPLPSPGWSVFLQGVPGQGMRGVSNTEESSKEEKAEMSSGIISVTQNDVTLRTARVLGANPGVSEQTEVSVILLFKE